MTTLLRSLLIIFTVIAGPVAFCPDVQAAQAERFQFEADANQHCPDDTVVSLNVPTRVYHFKGMRWFGNTKNGAYVCRKETDAEGDRATWNNQQYGREARLMGDEDLSSVRPSERPC